MDRILGFGMKSFSTPPYELVTNFMSAKARNRCASQESFYVVEKWPIQRRGQRSDLPSLYHQNCCHTPKNRLHLYFFCRIQALVIRAKFAYVVVLLQYALQKSYCFF